MSFMYVDIFFLSFLHPFSALMAIWATVEFYHDYLYVIYPAMAPSSINELTIREIELGVKPGHGWLRSSQVMQVFVVTDLLDSRFHLNLHKIGGACFYLFIIFLKLFYVVCSYYYLFSTLLPLSVLLEVEKKPAPS